ncbi:hypothetical protein [Niabella hirudinis]|uniref:hypothetical protein n=1 Tax=Niabella hirudinis TaxID=1285929 RepID=UPI003EBB452F
MENNKKAPGAQLNPKQGKRNYELRIGSSLHTTSVTEQADIYMEVALCCSPEDADGIVFTLEFSRPRFGSNSAYSKEQWVYTKIFDMHRNLVFRADKWGKIKKLLNPGEVLEAWEGVKRDLQDTAFGADPGLLLKLEAFGKKINADLTGIYRDDVFFQWLCNDVYGIHQNRATEKVINGFIGPAALAIKEEKQVLLAEEEKVLIAVSGSLIPPKMDIKKLNHNLFLQVGATGLKDLHFSYTGHYLFADGSGFFDQAALSVSAVIDRIYNRRMVYALNAI